MVLGGQLPGRVDGRRNPISFFMSNLLWWVWRSWLARQIVALEAVGSNPTIHPFYGSLAQLVEHLTFNQVVRGSNPRTLIVVRDMILERSRIMSLF